MFNLDIDFTQIVLKILLTLLLLVSMFACSDIYANTANPTWDYTVTKDSSNKINVTGTKNITVNGKQKTLTSTIKDFKPKNGLIGRTMYRRLMAGTAGLGVAAVAGFLHTKGWYLDTLTGLYVIGASQKYVWTCGGIQHNSPASYASCMLGVLQQQNPTYDFAINTIENDNDQVRVTFDRVSISNPDYKSTTVITGHGTIVNEDEEVKPTTLTPEILNDILTNPVVNTQSIGIPEALTPDIATGEVPTSLESYQDIAESLEQQVVYPSQTDVISTSTTTDAVTGSQTTTTTSTEFAGFCDYAVRLCSWLDWTQREHKQDTELDFPIDTPVNIDTTISFNGQCPAPLTYNFTYGGQAQSFGIKDFSPFCSMLNDILKPIVIAVSSFVAVLIIGGVRTDE